MNKLIELIRFEGKHYFVVSELAGRKIIEALATKLTSLEREILNYPKASIDINKEGSVSVKFMPDDLTNKINKLTKA